MKKEFLIVLATIVLSLIFATIGFIIRTQVYSDFLTPIGQSLGIQAFSAKRKDTHYRIYGYLPYWSLDNSRYLQLDKLTDIAYFAVTINENGTFQKRLSDGSAEPGYNNWRNNDKLKKLIGTAKQVGVNVALTVISHDNKITDNFLACKSCWETFEANLITELEYHGLKDVNLDFEYAGDTDDKVSKRYSEFVAYITKELHARYASAFVVVAANADAVIKPRLTNVAEITQSVDAIFVMAYDFHRPDSETAGPIAPINGNGTYADYDVATMLDDYLAVTPPGKLILGVPYYGYNWVVESADKYARRVSGTDEIGFSQSQTYEKLMETLAETRSAVLWDNVALAPYFTYTSPSTASLREVYFEDERSLRIKYQLAKTMGLAGIGVWALGYDGGYLELWNVLGDEFLAQ